MKWLLNLPFVLFIAISVSAEASLQDVCSNLKSYIEFVKCSPVLYKKNSIYAREQELSKINIEESGVLANPTLSLEVEQAKDDESTTTSTIGLSFPIELGGKRVARKNSAHAAGKLQEKEIFLELNSEQFGLIKKLHRMRLISREIKAVQDAIISLQKAIAVYQSRPLLNPEQKVGLVSFEVAINGYQNSLVILQAENNELENSILTNFSITKNMINELLPAAPKTWPSIEEKREDQNPSFQLELLKEKMFFSNVKFDEAKSNSWPTLEFGPVVGFSQGGSDEKTYGVQFSMPLQIFSNNRVERERSAVDLMAINREIEKQVENEGRQQAQVSLQYKKTLEVMTSGLRREKVEKSLTETKNLMLKGLISPITTLESYRSFIEWEEGQSKLELQLIELYLQKMSLDGKKNLEVII